MLQDYFNKNFVVVENNARGGCSSKSLIDEGRWDEILKNMKKGDYAIIPFGYNDGIEDEEKHFDANNFHRIFN